ncbi:MAG TPA: hypothetical protein PK954_14275 [Anaerolineales bacterium]|nr:hypothetical protein [Anaerolineales bacterium]HRF47961.1 hypothetical protein [Anaerolineales bacterium]
MNRQVLFLCTGNYYRSRIAEEMFNHFADRRGATTRAFSRGLALVFESGKNVGNLSRYALAELARYGISPRRADEPPQRVAAHELGDADIVIGLYHGVHAPMIEQQFPEFAGKVIYWSVPDLDELPANKAADRIFAEVTTLLAQI